MRKNVRNLWGGHLAGCVLYAVAAGNRFDRRGYSETLWAWTNSRHHMRTDPHVGNDSAWPWAMVLPMRDTTGTSSKRARAGTSLAPKCL
jgi:hypothetical protein